MAPLVVIDRRELLTCFLGAPLAAMACRARRVPALPPGEIVGASDRVGHRLRSDPPRSAPRWESHEVVIIGAGVAGLAAARRLEQAGLHDFVILELEPAEGGTARSGSSRVSAYPWGAHYLVAPMANNADLIRLLDEMGIVERLEDDGTPVIAEQFLCRDPEERIFYRGQWYEGLYLYAGASAEDLRQLREFEGEMARWAGWRDGKGRRAFAIPVAHGSDDADVTALDRLSMADWMNAKRFTSSRLRWLADYACRDDYGARLEETSAWAGIFYFASRVRKPGEESRPLITWPEGNGRLIAYLARSSRGRIRTGAIALNVASNGDVIVAHGDDVFGIHAKQVIVAAPQFIAARIVQPWRESPPAHVREFAYGAWMVANITVRDRPPSRGFSLAWDNVLVESPALGYVVATHQSGIDRGPTVLTYYFALCERNARQRLLATGRDEWAEIALADLTRAHPEIRSLAERIDVMRWGHAMVTPRPGFIWNRARFDAAKPVGSIHFAQTDLSGVALFEEAFFHGNRAADEVIAARRSSRT